MDVCQAAREALAKAGFTTQQQLIDAGLSQRTARVVLGLEPGGITTSSLERIADIAECEIIFRRRSRRSRTSVK